MCLWWIEKSFFFLQFIYLNISYMNCQKAFVRNVIANGNWRHFFMPKVLQGTNFSDAIKKNSLISRLSVSFQCIYQHNNHKCEINSIQLKIEDDKSFSTFSCSQFAYTLFVAHTMHSAIKSEKETYFLYMKQFNSHIS